MLTDFTSADRVYIACGYTGLRCGIDGLAAMVQQQFQLDSFSNTLFLFCGRRRDRIKALYWEGNGFVLLYKRLESGSFLYVAKIYAYVHDMCFKEYLCNRIKHLYTLSA